MIAHYRNHPLVEFAEPEEFAHPQLVPNDPFFPNWQAPLQTEYCNPLSGVCVPGTDAERAWDITTGSPDVPVGVLDSGLDTDHYEYVHRIARGEIYGYDFADEDPDFYDEFGHGTLVAGVIAAHTNNDLGIAGVCWQNPLVVLRTAFGSDRIDAVTWAADNGVRVISMSFGRYASMDWEQALMQYAFDRGVVLVGAAGNDGIDTPFYPAAFPTVLAVTGVSTSGGPCGLNWGDWIDLSGPTNVLTTARTEDNEDGLNFTGGTSMAAPFIAAAAGLVLSVNPDLTPTQVMDILRSTADDLGDPGFDVLTGYGRVNYHQALLAAMDTEPAVDTTPPTAAIVTPTSGSVLSGTVTVLVEAADDVRVTRVDLYLDGLFVSGDSVAPHEWSVDTTGMPDGEHTFSAVAYDAAGNAGDSPAVQVTIDNSPPAIPITETFTGTLNRRRPEQSFSIVVVASGTLDAEATFGGRKNAAECSVTDPSGQVVASATGGSPLRVDPVAVTSGTYTVRVARVSKNVSFTLTVTHP